MQKKRLCSAKIRFGVINYHVVFFTNTFSSQFQIVQKRVQNFLLTALLLLPGSILFAQHTTMSGVVVDKLSNSPLPNASATIKGVTDTNYTTKVITNHKGNYTAGVTLNHVYKVTITYLGYKSFLTGDVLIDNKNFRMAAISLLTDQADLGDLTITVKKPLIVMGADKIILNVAQSAMAAGSNAYDLLKRIPGVFEMNDKISFRGQSPRILINGRPSALTGEDLKNMLSDMQAGNIENIEVLPNPSSKYDAQDGAVINIILVKNKNFGTNYILSATPGAGTYFRNTATLDVNKRDKNVNIYGGYTYASGRQYVDISSTRYLPGAKLYSGDHHVVAKDNHNYKIGADYDISKRSSLGMLVTGFVNDRTRDAENISIFHRDTNIADSAARVMTDTRIKVVSPAVNLYYKTSDSTGRELLLNLDYMQYNKDWNDHFTNSYLDPKGASYLPDTYLRNNSAADLSVYSFSADYSKLSKKGKWDLGFKTSNTRSDNNLGWEIYSGTSWVNDVTKSNRFIYKETVIASYASYSGHIKSTVFQAGLRLEQTLTEGYLVAANEKNNRAFLNLFPTLSVSFVKNPRHQLSVSYRKTILRFGFDYVNPFITYQSQYAYLRGNPDLQPQLNHKFSFSYLLGQGLLAGMDYTHSVKALGVSYHAMNQSTVTSYDNFNKSDIYYGYVNYSKPFSNTWSENINLAVGYINVDANAGATSSPGETKPFYSLQFGNNFKLKKDFTVECSITSMSAITSGIIQRRAYYMVDAGISKSLLSGKIVMKLGVTDLFNSFDNRTHVDYQGVNMDTKTKLESRFLSFSVKYRFGNNNIKKKPERQSKVEDLKNRLNP